MASRGLAIGSAICAALALASCHRTPGHALVAAVPSDTIALAAIDLAGLRASPLRGKLPQAVASLAEPLRGVRELLLAWNGRNLLLLAGGDFAQPPAGYTALAKGMAAAGAPDRVEAARAQLALGTNVVELPKMEGTLRGVIKGDGRLPLSGNLANANRLLRGAETTEFAVQLGDDVEIRVTVHCRDLESARHVEESLRGVSTLGAAAARRDPELSAMLRSVRISREEHAVNVKASGAPEVLAKFLAF